MHTITLTGYKGLVGSQINNLIDATNYDKFIDNFDDYSVFLRDQKIDTVIHAAARVGGLLDNQNNKIAYYLDNSRLNNIVFEAAFNNNIKNFINFSSTCVFPAEAPMPLKESYMNLGAPFEGNDAYAYAKRMMQYLCHEAHKKHLNYVTIIPTNIFGPNDNFNINKGHVIPALIHKCYLAKKNNGDLNVWGNGKSLKEFIFSKDIARITVDLLNKVNAYDSFIVSNSQEISIEECAVKIAKIFDFKGNIIFDTNKPEGQYRKHTDNSRLKELFPNFVFTNFEDALSETIEWFIKNYNIARK